MFVDSFLGCGDQEEEVWRCRWAGRWSDTKGGSLLENVLHSGAGTALLGSWALTLTRSIEGNLPAV